MIEASGLPYLLRGQGKARQAKGQDAKGGGDDGAHKDGSVLVERHRVRHCGPVQRVPLVMETLCAVALGGGFG